MADAGLPPRSGRVTLTGTVRSVQRRTEWIGEGSRSIWTFRMDGVDQAGGSLSTVEVEMRGFSFEGSLNEGDSVRVSGRWRRGVIRADQLQNLTTGALVRAKTYRGLRVAVLALFVVIAAGIVFFAVDSARESNERREQLEQQRQELIDRQGEVPEGFCEAAESAGLTPPECED